MGRRTSKPESLGPDEPAMPRILVPPRGYDPTGLEKQVSVNQGLVVMAGSVINDEGNQGAKFIAQT